jgi:hypothetical protein
MGSAALVLTVILSIIVVISFVAFILTPPTQIYDWPIVRYLVLLAVVVLTLLILTAICLIS